MAGHPVDACVVRSAGGRKRAFGVCEGANRRPEWDRPLTARCGNLHACPASPEQRHSMVTHFGVVAGQTWRDVERRRRLARDVATLHDIDDRMLRDIGLNRWEILNYVRRLDSEPAPPPSLISRLFFIAIVAVIISAMVWADRPDAAR